MKNILVTLVALVALTACSSDKNETLRNLKAERDKISTEIAKLEKELASEGKLQVHENKTYVTINEVHPKTFRHYVEVKGNVESDNNVMVPAEMPGIVTSVAVKEGQSVAKGQLLATIDSDMIVKQIEALTTQLELATTVYERQKRLWEKEIGSEIQFLQAKTNKESAEKQLEILNRQLEMTRITSPLSGMVEQIMLKEGEMAAAGVSGIRIVGTGDLKIKAKLSESYYGHITKGDSAQIKVPAADATFTSNVFAVTKAIDAGSRTFGIDIRPPAHLPLMPNMLAVVTVNDYTAKNAIAVPVNLVQTDGSGKFLFVVSEIDGKTVANRRNVKTNKTYKGKVEIIEGLKAGDKIIVSGYQNVSDNQTVTVQ